MKLSTPLLALALGTLTLQESQASTLFDFQTSPYSILEADQLTYNSDSNGLQITNLDTGGGTITVIFDRIDISEFTQFQLAGTLHSENYGTSFTITFYNEDLEYQNFIGQFDYGSGYASINLFPEIPFAGGLTNIIGFTYNSTGMGEPLDYTFERIEAIPEPSVYALSFLAAGGAYLLRRRRAMLNR